MVAAVTHEVRAFLRCEEADRGADEIDHLVEGPRSGGVEERFQFGEGELDRIEVRAVRRQKAEGCPDGLERHADVRVFVDGQIVHDDDIARSERGDQDLLEVGEEGRRVDRPVEDGGRAEAVESERRHDRVRLPVSERGVILQARTAGTSAVAPEQIGRHAAFIEEDVLGHVAQRLPRAPLAPGRRDIRPALFVGVDRFF